MRSGRQRGRPGGRRLCVHCYVDTSEWTGAEREQLEGSSADLGCNMCKMDLVAEVASHVRGKKLLGQVGEKCQSGLQGEGSVPTPV